MKFDIIKELIKIVEESNIQKLEVKDSSIEVRIDKGVAGPIEVRPQVIEKKEEKKEEEEKSLTPVKAPIVGTFYRSPAPGASPYVEVGDMVEKGKVLCIIEAMKVMNEIESEVSGRVARILVKNEEPVEFGQELFLIEPK